MDPQRRAAIDIGTNSVRLLVADLAPGAGGARLVPVLRDRRVTRLGQGLGRTGRLLPAAADRTAAAIGELAARARAGGAGGVVAAGTSALRDAADRDEFCRRIRREHGLTVRVLTGREEAELTFLGAAFDVASFGGGSAVVVDIGGGSTELIRGSVQGGVSALASVDIGAVRLTESCFRTDPPGPADWERLEQAAGAGLAPALAQLGPLAEGGGVLVATGGTAATLAAMDQGLTAYDPDRIHGYRVSREALARWVQRLRRAPLEERRRWPGLEPDRADIILAGAFILLKIADGLGAPGIVVSDKGLLEGLLLSTAPEPSRDLGDRASASLR
ncbi:MAG: hypothetical protein H0Z37_03025 [Firmicutes bacterium]|nr:hypothetical protein [Bacillota bacterium]